MENNVKNEEMTQFQRTELLIGKENVNKLKKATVAVFGIGGVGSFVVEGLARAGIGKLILVDKDNVDITNINRQIHANMATIGRAKVDCMAERIKQINPELQVQTYKVFYGADCKENILDEKIDYIVDCVDTVSSKIFLIEQANQRKIPIISSMGTGNKLDPTKFEVADIKKTSVCPLAKVIRKELKKRNINSLKVVYSKEEPIKNNSGIIASISFVPSVAGLIIAGEVIKDIIK